MREMMLPYDGRDEDPAGQSTGQDQDQDLSPQKSYIKSSYLLINKDDRQASENAQTHAIVACLLTNDFHITGSRQHIYYGIYGRLYPQCTNSVHSMGFRNRTLARTYIKRF